MRSFRNKQRVFVRVDADEKQVQRPGTVVRLRRADDGAWVRLDSKAVDPSAHKFPRGDNRENHVLAYPEDCAEVTGA